MLAEQRPQADQDADLAGPALPGHRAHAECLPGRHGARLPACSTRSSPRLAKAGSALPRSMEILLTYPFPDSVLGAIKGDYLNVFMLTNFRTLPA
ncbi:hypothetical protein G5V59_11865 [Nocardioides sp. W3-2-3]|uniref:hypothetical protein n=1 Tax=Nocardioides convexus TaxID=2712224 RepID=UPI00241833D2|nr:hypothetical protein [Nocardioides convexus]NHA00489.1 hypothetical protein [Nocardioides convexus]